MSPGNVSVFYTLILETFLYESKLNKIIFEQKNRCCEALSKSYFCRPLDKSRFNISKSNYYAAFSEFVFLFCNHHCSL